MEKDETYHWEKCSKCSETRNKETHTVTTWSDKGNGTHSGTCECGQTISGEHEYGTDNKCTKCGSEKATTTCEHDWKMEKDETYHWEKCSKCSEIRNKETHTMSAAQDAGNGNHVKTCTKCNYKKTSEHEYGTDGKCKECGTEKTVEACTHDWQYKSDETYHWEKCSKCSEIRNKEKHTVTTWSDRGDGTHSGTCDKCNKTITGNHNKGTDNKCTNCKANLGNNDNSSSNNNSNSSNNNNNSSSSNNSSNNDNTSGEKVIPNTGKGTIITIGITTTLVLLGIAAVGLKKYKDIV